MGRRNNAFGRIKEERNNLSFFKIFQSADLSSESMRAFPYDFMSTISPKDFSYKMVIRAQWGSSWEVEVSKNPRYYYMEKLGWSQFVSDNALGENEFITFTHKGKMCFNVNIYEQNGKEILIPRKPPTVASSSGIKKEQGESSYKDVKMEEETGEAMGGVELEVRKKKAVESEASKKKKRKIKKVKKNGVPGFVMTIKKSYLKFLAIPKLFVEDHLPNEPKMFTMHHSSMNGSWNVLTLVRDNRTIFSSGWSRLAREYPLSVGDRCTFKLIKPTEFLLVISKKAKKEITVL